MRALFAAFQLLSCASVVCAAVNVIPAPKIVEEKRGAIDLSAPLVMVLSDKPTPAERTAAECVNTRLVKDFKLAPIAVKTSNALSAEERRNSQILIGSLDAHPAVRPYAAALQDDATFLRQAQSPEAYVVRMLPAAGGDGRQVAVLSGKGDAGTLHAAATLVQLVRRAGARHTIPAVAIRDYPDLEYRWASIPRRNMQDAFRWKINLAPTVWPMPSTKPNASGQLAINRAARALGLKAVSIFMADFGFKNRRMYPDGETYSCIEATKYQNSRAPQAGFCPSNDELLKLKCEWLRRYVRNNKPGVLFIHFVDWDTYGLAERAWKERCPECRKRWPNDRLEAPDGKAGAQARMHNAMAQAILSVRSEDGYDARRDSLILFVLCPYGRWSEPDELWEKELEYYVNLSKAMTQDENILFCIREQGPRQDGRSMRMRELADALKSLGRGHKVLLYHNIGDNRRTTARNWPVRHMINFRWLATPVMSASFEGAQGLFLAGASQPALLAEYMWNQRARDHYSVAPADRSAWGNAYVSFLSAAALPPEIFAPGRFFDRVYQNLYGVEAGKLIADALRPVLFNGGIVQPEPDTAWLRPIDRVWVGTDLAALHNNWLTLFKKIVACNQKAVKGLDQALAADDLPAGRADEVRKLRRQYENGLYWAQVVQAEAEYYHATLAGKEAAADLLPKLLERFAAAPEDQAKVAAARRERIQAAADKLATVKSDRDAWLLKIAELKKKAGPASEALRKEIRVSASYNEAPLSYLRIAVIGKAAPELLKDPACRYVERLDGRKELPETIMNYDVLCLQASHKFSPDELTRIRNFVAAGRGLMLVGPTPYCMLGDTDLTSIADWLGARSYGNWRGKAAASFESAFTQGQEEWLAAKDFGRGSAVLARFVTGVPVVVFKERPDLALIAANKCGSGRVLYSSTPWLPTPMLHRILLWLGYNKLHG